MKTTVVRYRLKPGQTAENERLIDGVLTQLASEQPEGVSYQVFKLADGVSFMHVSCVPDSAQPHPITSLAAFKAFAAGIKDRAEEGPDAMEVKLVGKYLG